MQFELSKDTVFVPKNIWLGWATSAASLIKVVFGEESPYYTNFANEVKKSRGYDTTIKTLQEIFLSAKEAFESGYVFNVELTISGEIFGDFVVLALIPLHF